MEFCDRCKSIMIYQGDKAICRKCGFEKEVGDEEIVTVTKKSKEEIPIIEGDVKTLPTTQVSCPACGNKEAFWWLRQLRAADESEVRFFRCTKCGKTWREYD